MKSFAWHISLFLILGLQGQDVLNGAQLPQLPPPASHRIDFQKEIKPIIEQRCVNCHGHGRDKGEFQMDTKETLMKGGASGAAVIEGNSAKSHLIELVAGLDPDSIMPKKGTKLTREQIGLLRAWIDQGVQWDASVTFARAEPLNLKPRRPELPPASSKATNPIDRLLTSYYKGHKTKPAEPVEDRIFARRVYLDVIGLLPPPSELEAFVADKDLDKRTKLVQKLLGHQEDYALDWLSFWNDLLRNDYQGTGYIDGGRLAITQWLYSSLETNKPYNQFVAELIHPTPASEGFTKGIVWRGVVNASQQPHMQAAQNISQVFMGVNLKCASCHDSFINDLTLSDAYGLASVYAEGPLEMVLCDKPTGKTAAPKFIYPQLGVLETSTNKSERLDALARLITKREDGRLTRTVVNRFWQKFFGRGLVEPVDDMEQPAWNSDVLDWLAEDFADHGYDVKHLIETILTSRAYSLPSVNALEQTDPKFVFHGPVERRMTSEQFRDALGTLTGGWYESAVPKLVQVTGATNDFKAVRSVLVAADRLQTALGRPNREQVVTVRSPTATTLQALELTNGSELAKLISRGAEAMLSGSKMSTDALIQSVYEKSLGRQPTRRESRAARALLGQPAQQAGLEDLMWSLAMLPEFQLIY